MIFSFQPFPELIRQRQILDNLENAFRHKKKWLQRREEIEDQILKLKEKCRKNIYDPKMDEKELKTLFQKDLELESRLKKEKQQIDILLDEIEGMTEENLEQKRFELLCLIWELYPETKQVQESKLKRWNHLNNIELDISGIEIILNKIREHLVIAAQARQSIKGVGLLNYIFGLSPNFIIEKQLNDIHSLITNSTFIFQNHSKNKYTPELYNLIIKLSQWLEEVKVKCGKSWSFRHLDAFFLELEKNLNFYDFELGKNKEEVKLEIAKLDEELEKWYRLELG